MKHHLLIIGLEIVTCGPSSRNGAQHFLLVFRICSTFQILEALSFACFCHTLGHMAVM